MAPEPARGPSLPVLAELSFSCNLQSYNKFTAKLLLLSHSENYIKLTFVVISHNIFLVRLFSTRCLLRPEATATVCPSLSYATALGLPTNINAYQKIYINTTESTVAQPMCHSIELAYHLLAL